MEYYLEHPVIIAGGPFNDVCSFTGDKKDTIVKKHPAKKYLFFILFFGTVVQLGAFLLDDPIYMTTLYEKFNDVDLVPFIWNFSFAPFLYYWKLLYFRVRRLAYLAWRISQINSVSLFRYTWLTFISIAVSVIGLIFYKKLSRMKAVPHLITFSIILIPLLLSVYTLSFARSDPWYYPERDDIRSATNDLTSLAGDEDTILVDYYLSPGWYHFWNYGKIPMTWYSLPVPTSNIKDGGLSEINMLADFLDEKQIEVGDRLWLLTDTNVYELHPSVRIEALDATINICDVRQYESTSDAKLTWLYTYYIDTRQ